MLHFLFKSNSRENGKFNLTYNILDEMYINDNVLFVDFQKADLRFPGGTNAEKDYYFISRASRSKKYDKILLTDTWESLSYNKFQYTITKLIDEKIFEPSQIIVMFFLYPNKKMLDFFKNFGVEVWHVNYFFPRIHYFNSEYPIPEPKRKLLSFNNIDTVSRRYIISQLLDHNIANGISWGNASLNRTDNVRRYQKIYSWYQRDLNECCKNDDIDLIKKYDYWFNEAHSVDSFDSNSDDRYTLKNNVYEAPINLVTETRSQPFFTDISIPRDVYTQDYFHISEKTVKVLLTNQIFFIFSSVGVLNYLQNFGFKTFGDYIDESYDYEENWQLRAKKIVTEIDKIMKMSEKNWQKLWTDIQPILTHNRKWMKEFTEAGKYMVKL